MNDLFEYKQTMNALQFTPEQKEALAEAAASAAQGQQTRKRRPVFRTALIAAVLAVVLAAGSSAAGILPEPVDVFAPLFGGAVAQTEVIDKIGHPIGAGDTNNGVTITADAIMGDQYNAVIVYTISRDDGERLLPEGVQDPMLMMGGFGGASWTQGGTHGSAWFVDEDPEDNQIQLVEVSSSDVPMTRGTATAEFQDLRYWDGTKEQPQPLYPGHWKLRFEVDYEDCSVHLGGGETFSQDGMTFTIDEVTVSPLAVRAAYTTDEAVVWDDAPSGRQSAGGARQVGRFMDHVEIFLTKTDGSVIDLTNAGGGISPDYDSGVSHCTKGQVLEEIVPLEELASISVGGVVYDIPHD